MMNEENFKSEIVELWNAVNKLNSEPIRNALPVGSILLSSLSKTAFQAQYDGIWVPCHGQEIDEFGKVPDLQDRFPRVVADEEKLGTNQEQSTNRGDLGVSIDRFSAGSVRIQATMSDTSSKEKADIKMYSDSRPPARGRGGDWHFYQQSNSAIQSDKVRVDGELIDGSHSLIGSDPNQGTLMGHGGQQIFKDSGHTHDVTVSFDKTASVTGASVVASVIGGEQETRPKSCYINAFIRIR